MESPAAVKEVLKLAEKLSGCDVCIDIYIYIYICVLVHLVCGLHRSARGHIRAEQVFASDEHTELDLSHSHSFILVNL